MLTHRRQAVAAVVLGFLSLVAVVFSHLALTDIAHGETDVAQEWTVVQISALVVVISTVVSLATIARFLNLRR